MLIPVFYQLFLFIGDPVLLGGFKLGDEVLYLSVPGAIFFGHVVDAEFILDEGHGCWVELIMAKVEIIFWEWRGRQTKDLGPEPAVSLLDMLWGWQASTFWEVTAAWEWGNEVNRKRALSGDCNRPPRWWALCFLLLSCLSFVYAIMKIISEHAQNRHTKFEGRDKGDDN